MKRFHISSSNMAPKFTNRFFFEHLREKKLSFQSSISRNALFRLLKEKYSVWYDDLEEMIRTKITTFSSHLSTSWKEGAKSTESTFLKKYENWLNLEIVFPENSPTSANIAAKRGRPRKDFIMCQGLV